MNKKRIRIGLIGPVPPPYGGMSVQTRKLEGLLNKEGLEVMTIPVNFMFPRGLRFIDKIKYIRAVVRLFFYLIVLMKTLRGVDLIHILSNSYLSFFLYSVPAVIIANLYSCKVVVNYRGGLAEEFLKKYGWAAFYFFKKADAIIVPSGFLMKVFKEYGFMADIVPNIVDLDQFFFQGNTHVQHGNAVNLLVVRNFEKIYNIGCAIRAFQRVQKEYPQTRLILVGEGSQEYALKQMVTEMKIKNVEFTGRLQNQQLPNIYKKASVVLNPSDADNLPISVLEAFAAGIPVVSTNVGGIPYLIKDGFTGLLVNKDDDKGMSQRVLNLMKDSDFYREIVENGKKEAKMQLEKCPDVSGL
jgi:glycosyltransferase involved in cell wall biosynthesis